MNAKELLREVGEAPDDDGRRLRLADWYARNGEPERAEFIRLQVEEKRFGPRTPAELLARARVLLKAHEGRWRIVGCPECGSDRKSKRSGTCLTCDGAGDVGGLVCVTAGEPVFTVPVEWRGGTPHAVSCKLFEAFDGYGGVRRWAFRVGAHHRTVRAFRLTDREPAEDGGLWWLRAGDRETCEADAQRVPRPLLTVALAVSDHSTARHKKSDPEKLTALGFCDREIALSALATAAGACVRAAVAGADRREPQIG